MNSKFLIGIVLMIFMEVLNAQDFHFSQFYAMPLTLNPALNGLITGDLRGSVNYRNQIKTLTPFTTYAASFETKILKKIIENDVFAIGVVVVRDELYNKTVNSSIVMFSTAYHDRIGKNDYMAAGFQGGMYQRYLNMNAFTYPEQWDQTTGQASLPSTVEFQNLNVAVFDMNLGLIWYHYIKTKSSIFLGASVFHLTQPKLNYLNTDGMIPRRYIINGGSRILLDNHFSLLPKFILMSQAKATEVILGSTIEYRTKNGNAFKTGGWLRYNDTFILCLGMELKGVEIGLSYDFIANKKYLGQNRGGVEFSVILTSFYKKNVSLNGNPGIKF